MHHGHAELALLRVRQGRGRDREVAGAEPRAGLEHPGQRGARRGEFLQDLRRGQGGKTSFKDFAATMQEGDYSPLACSSSQRLP